MRWLALVCLAGCAIDGFGVSEQLVDEPISAVVYKHGGDENGIPAVEPNVRVDFIAPDDSVQTVFTDANGIASAVSPAGTRVVVYQMTLDHHRLVRVFYATQPGDDLVVGLLKRNSYPTLGTVHFSIPKRSPNALYRLQVSCGGFRSSGGNMQDVTVIPCPQATNATAVAYAFDPNTGEILSGPSVKRGLDLTQLVGTTVHMPGYARQPSTVTGTFLRIPTGAFSSWQTSYYFDDDPQIFANSGGPFFNPGDPATLSYEIEGVGNRTINAAQYELSNVSYVGQILVENQRTSNYVFDGSNTVRSVGDGNYDFATKTFHWTEGAGRQATLMQIRVVVSNFTPNDWQIELYAPGDVTSLTLPQLTPEVTPVAGNRVSGSLHAYQVTGESYDSLLEQSSSRWLLGPNEWPGFTGSVWFANGNLQSH